MSHLVSIQTKLRDPVAISAACRRLGISEPVHGTATIFTTEATGLLLQLPEWDYPAAIDIATGEVTYDNYGGKWGKQEHLDRFMQAYSTEKAKIEARKAGQVVTEQTLSDGSIKLTIQVA